ncbi:MAG: TIGR01777 family oxidoreductase [Gemmatimonadaceae bacterium]|nr:TIGR01777 family oxidoreductase [Gemmatimonadaceae bacterium]
MRIVIPGGTGQVGTLLARAFHADGHEVVVLSRRPAPAPWRIAKWDARTVGPWAAELEGADAVINLAGRNVNCRYSPQNRRDIMSSRVESASAVGQAIARCDHLPSVWLQASTATIYAHRFDAPNDEASGVIGGAERDVPASWRFSIEVATAWEHAAREAVPAGTRLVLLRSAMVMSPDAGGIFATLLRLVRFGLGGPVAGGRQYVSWIHERDFVRSIYWLIAHPELSGAVNIASPHPVPYRDFMRTLRRAAGVPIGLPATRWMLALGTWALRTESELVLKSRRVIPGRLLASGFTFDYSEWQAAAESLVQRPESRVRAV